MFTFTILLFSFFIFFSGTITAAQPYNATDNFLLNCGSSSPTTIDGRRWDGDEDSKFLTANIAAGATSFSSSPSFQAPSVDQIPYATARIFNSSSFTYRFPVSQGPKFLRLYFYPANYSDLIAGQSFFSVTSNGYSLLTNFSASMTASFLDQSSFFREFIVHVQDNQFLNVTFTPSPNSFAFINGIEIVSMPENLYFRGDDNLKSVGTTSGPGINNSTALENIYRLNVGGGFISGNNDTGMYRSWDRDDTYLFPLSALGFTPVAQTPIKYTPETPNYTAPELVYETQRSRGNITGDYTMSWLLPVDSGFWYMVRLHFCSIITQYTFKGQVIFRIFINNQTAENEADLFNWVPAGSTAVFKDYLVFVGGPNNLRTKQDLSIAMNPNEESQEYRDFFLNGLEVFKLDMTRNLAGPNPNPSSKTQPSPESTTPAGKRNKKKTPYAVIAGGVAGGIVFLSILVLILFRQRRRVKHYATADDKSSWGPAHSETKSCHSSLPSDRCRRFSLAELKEATDEFNDSCVIGNGGFGKVYKGYMENAGTIVAIKRLNPSSNQGLQEFETEIAMLSKLRHVHLVSLVGYCDDSGEMILVYDYMAHGTLRQHLYKSKNSSDLSWKTRLRISIGAARGLHYLHTGSNRAIIHRDVKSTNILLDENWVAKVSDFGLSKLGPGDHQQQNHVSTVVKGSIGYVDPEYYRTQQLTDKSDVYSFGVVLLEVLCARHVLIPTLPREQASLAEWAKLCYRNKATLLPIVDRKVVGEIAPECLRKFEEVALNCLKDQRSERPSMEEVVYYLEFALQLQEGAAKTGGGGDAAAENQELPFLMHGEQTTTDDDVFTGSSAIRNGTSSISSSFEGFKSETVFSEMMKSTGR